MKLHPFMVCYRPHGTAVYQDLSHKDRMNERELAHLAGEWRHPAVGEDLPLMTLIKTQHQMNRSWHHIRTDLPDDYYTSNPLFES